MKVKVAAVFIGWQDMIDEAPEAIYNIVGDHNLRGSTVSFGTLVREGIEPPDTPPPPAMYSPIFDRQLTMEYRP